MKINSEECPQETKYQYFIYTDMKLYPQDLLTVEEESIFSQVRVLLFYLNITQKLKVLYGILLLKAVTCKSYFGTCTSVNLCMTHCGRHKIVHFRDALYFVPALVIKHKIINPAVKYIEA